MIYARQASLHAEGELLIDTQFKSWLTHIVATVVETVGSHVCQLTIEYSAASLLVVVETKSVGAAYFYEIIYYSEARCTFFYEAPHNPGNEVVW